MNDLIDRLQAMGRRGGWVALGIATGCLPAGAILTWVALYVLDGQWLPAGVGFGASLLLVGGMVFGLVGIRLLTQRHYPSAAELFPPLAPRDFEAALRGRPSPVCACAKCRVVLDAAFSTGACPVCASSVDYYEVANDEDADMVILAAG